MIVVVLSKCPLSLRGDLTLWLQEIATNVYVGHVSARVREQLWERIIENIKSGQATMVYSTNNEQRHSFRVHGTTWEVIDIEGLELILKPSLQYGSQRLSNNSLRTAHSKAKAAQQASKFSKRNRIVPSDYVVIDIETTGLDPTQDEIIEVACLKIINNNLSDQRSYLVKISVPIPSHITKLTGIDDALIQKEGRKLAHVISDIVEFIGDYPIIAHNVKFDLAFIYSACEQLGLPPPSGSTIDTQSLAKKKIRNVMNYKLQTLAESCGFSFQRPHRALNDCITTLNLYQFLQK